MEIKPKGTVTKKDQHYVFWRKSLFLACFVLFSLSMMYGQTRTVTGTVIGADNEPLTGVNVIIQGTTNGTITDFDGNYSITVEPGNVLEFSYIGMRSQAITVGEQTVINVVLEDDATMLSETVVIGYGTQKKADLTGSIGSVSTDVIMQQPALNAVQSIQGKVSGASIIGNDQPGSEPTIIVRGLGTALGGRKPLYIVDGFPVDDIKSINSSDIASIDILKDASSASIYGVRAANGVILVTTKKGKTGSSQINVESYVGIKNVQNRVKMANASQYIEYYNENLASIGADYRLAPASEQLYDTDWYDELLHTGITTNNVVSLSGGTERVDYFFSYNYYDEKGLLEGQKYNRTTIRNNNVYKFFNNRLKFTQNLNISFSNESPKDASVFNEAYRQSPLVPVRYANGRYGQSFVNTTTGIVGYDRQEGETLGRLNSIGNPLFSVANQNDKNKTFYVQGGMEGEVRIFEFLKFNSRLGVTKNYQSNRNFNDIRNAWLNSDPTRTVEEFNTFKVADPTSVTYANNSLSIEDKEYFRWIWENYLTFTKSFDRHNVEVVLGASREKTNIGKEMYALGYDVPEKSQYWNVNLASDQYAKTVRHTYYTPRALASYFGRLQYNYDNKYYLSATVRRDGSSTFRPSGDYWGTFPSVGLGWTISRESFLQDVEWLDFLKLRGTWGKLGNQDVPLNVSQILTNPGSASYNYVFGPNQDLVYGAAYGTPALDLTWEITKEWGLGFDMNTLANRLTFNFDYYEKRNTNTILYVSPVLNSPYSQDYYAHGAEVLNRGIELAVGWSDELRNGLYYEISANYSYNKNKVVSVEAGYDGSTGGSLSNGQITKRLAAGQPLYAWWMFEADGVWQTQEEIDNGATYGTPAPGYLKYKDQNGDGVIDDQDKVYMGSYLPTSNYGIHVGLGYRNFDFNIDGYGVAGNKVYNGLKGTRIDGGENITLETFKNRWTGPGSTNFNPGADHDSYASSYYLESGAFFRINNITLGYTFQDLVMPGTKLRLYFTAQNPFVITGYSGFSPEISSDGDPRLTTGLELSAYPTTRNFLFGVNIQF